MKSRILTRITAMILFATLVTPVRLAAQHTRYKLIDLGTLGGPHSYGSVNGEGFTLLNDSGVVASYADLAVADPNASFFCYDPDCFQAHASEWKDGEITDLGALPVNNNSAAGSINARGWAVGQSQSSTIDPVLGIPEFRAVLWRHGHIIDLDTFAGGTESLGIYVNDAGQAIGLSTINTEPDPLVFFFQTHIFIWENGKKLDIGTLGGADTLVGASCSHPPEGMMVGGSTTTTTLNPDTGLPTADPFLWDHGKLIDLGTLGGTNGFGQCVNHRRQVIGASSLVANPAACSLGGPGCHAFFWENGVMTDLGTLGGDTSEAIWLNETGMIVGSADLPGDQIHHAVFWKNGEIHDLGTVSGDACSRGRGLNARGQVVGLSSDCSNALHAFVWEEGGPALDLNDLIPPGSGFQLTRAFNINDRGEILASADPIGVAPIDDEDLGHLVLLVPCVGPCAPESNIADTRADEPFSPKLSGRSGSALTRKSLHSSADSDRWQTWPSHRPSY
jgi:probable HAF family extracellular repeat protein